jgi:hypothetical protein
MIRSNLATAKSLPQHSSRASRQTAFFKLPLMLRIGTGQLPFSGVFVDVSASGLGIETPVALAEQASIELVLVRQVLKMRVTWRRRSADGQAYRYGLACETESRDLTTMFSLALAL